MDMKDFRSCYITYKAGLFLAYSFDYDKRYYTPREVDNELEGLLLKCRKAGFNHLDGLTREVIDAYRGIDDPSEKGKPHLYKEDMPVLYLAEKLFYDGTPWADTYSVRMVSSRPETPPAEEDTKATKVNLERYGIKPLSPRGGVVTSEAVNKLLDELGL